jgi:hypothetical protein
MYDPIKAQEIQRNIRSESRKKALERKKYFMAQKSPEQNQRDKEDAATRKFFKGEAKHFRM